MARFVFFLLSWLAISFSPWAIAAEPSAASIDKIFAAWDKPDTPGVALAVVRDGKVVYSRGYGMANLEYSVPITATTVFHVASVSKQFTAFAIQLLAQDGKLALDDEVRKYLPELQVQGPPITIRQMIHHTSGLRDQWSLLLLAGLRLDDVITEGDILSLLWRQEQLNFKPGDEELYNNSGYTLLAQIVKRVSGQSFAAFAKERIFDPLGMTRSHFQEHYGTLVPGRAYSYVKQKSGYQHLALSYSNVGATSLFTTVDDLVRWNQNFDDGRVGGPGVQAAMLARGKLNSGKDINYASGVIQGRYRGIATVEHAGGDAGFRSYFFRLPQPRLTVLVLGNAAELNTGELVRRVADQYLEGTPGLQPPKTYPAEVDLLASDLAAYVGDFELRPGLLAHFSVEGNRLVVQATGQGKFPLFASAPNQFYTKAFESSVTFAATVGNALAASALWQQGGRDVTMPRVNRELPTLPALQACVGDYYSTELRTLYTLRVSEGKLLLRYPRGELPLQPVTGNYFQAAYPFGSVALMRNAAGVCDGLRVTTGRVRNLRFDRVKLVTGAPAS